MSEPLLKSIRVACSVERAFETFTSGVDLWWPRGHRKLEGLTLVLEPREGGRFFERAGDEEHELGRVLDVDRPKALRYSWWPGALSAPTEVYVRFTGDGATTLVEVEHHEADAALGDRWGERVQIFTRAWDTVLAALLTHMEGEVP